MIKLVGYVKIVYTVDNKVDIGIQYKHIIVLINTNNIN
jgi:hypothetical protein